MDRARTGGASAECRACASVTRTGLSDSTSRGMSKTKLPKQGFDHSNQFRDRCCLDSGSRILLAAGSLGLSETAASLLAGGCFSAARKQNRALAAGGHSAGGPAVRTGFSGWTTQEFSPLSVFAEARRPSAPDRPAPAPAGGSGKCTGRTRCTSRCPVCGLSLTA